MIQKVVGIHWGPNALARNGSFGRFPTDSRAEIGPKHALWKKWGLIYCLSEQRTDLF